MKVFIEGSSGVFGSFLTELLPQYGFELDENAPCVILAVPFSAYEEMVLKHLGKFFINICSVQSVSNSIIEKHTTLYTGLHPLFGPRTPADKRNSILTKECLGTLEVEFLGLWSKIGKIIKLGPTLHDASMAHTHVVALKVYDFAKPLMNDAKEISDELIPHSFRKLKEFVDTLDNLSEGTKSSILSNPLIPQKLQL